MSLSVHGLSHKTAPIDIREKVAFDPAQILCALPVLNSKSGIRESMIISTCNRTEMYCNIKEGMENEPLIWVSNYLDIDVKLLRPHFYCYRDEQAIKHTLRVGSGLDSLILGEPQILGQLKRAHELALQAGTVGKMINKLMQVAFSTSKLIRSKTEIGKAPISIAYAATKLAQQIHGNLNSVSALLIGAGETITLVAKHLKQSNIKHVVVANRSAANSKKIVDICGGEIVNLVDIPREISNADIVVSSVNSRNPIIQADVIELALKRRAGKPIFLVDLGVPRNIDWKISSIESAYLYGIDDLKTIVETNIGARQEATIEAEQIVRFKASDYLEWLRVQDASNIISTYRENCTVLTDPALASAIRAIENGRDPKEVIKELAIKINSKLMHNPTMYLRKHADDPMAVKIAKEILGINRKKI